MAKNQQDLCQKPKDLLAIRRDIDRSRTIMDVVRKRTKIERRIFDCEYELFEAQGRSTSQRMGPCQEEQGESKKKTN